jgi:hypothetical protein
MAFVLCGPRSGSTLLRFVIHAHPESACPPESLLPDLCARLSHVWSTNSSGSSPGSVTPPGDTTPAILPDGITPWPLPSAVPQQSSALTSPDDATGGQNIVMAGGINDPGAVSPT